MEAGDTAFWIGLTRAIVAFALGVMMFLLPDQTGPRLANFMGMYWLIGSIVSLRWDSHGRRARGLALWVGAIGVVAGLIMLNRGLIMGWVVEATFFLTLGIVILLTGVLHIFGGIKTRQNIAREQSSVSLFLGILETVLGLLLIIRPLARGPLIYLMARPVPGHLWLV